MNLVPLHLAALAFLLAQDAQKPPAAPGPAAPAANAPAPAGAQAPSSAPAPANAPAPVGARSPLDAPSRPSGAWRTLDRVEMIVNDDMVTARAIQKMLDNLRNRQTVSPEDEPRVLQQAKIERVRNLIAVQSGQDLGLDPKVIKHEVDEHVNTLIRQRDGVASLAEFLQSLDLDSSEAREEITSNIYRDVWDKFITGAAPLPGSRLSRDRYVRPGLMQLYYQVGLEHPETLGQIGGKPQLVVLQYIFVDPRKHDGDGPARDLLKSVRKRILDGEDMADLCEKYSESKARGGVTEPLPELRLAAIDPTLGEFLKTAKPGDLSDVMSFENSKHDHFWRLAKLVDRTPPVVPDFHAAEVQQKVADGIQQEYEDLRRAIAIDLMFRGSYVWPEQYATKR
jgi:hypothetical protein